MDTNNSSYLSKSVPETIESIDLNNYNIIINICEICYDSNKSIELNCCNKTKRICNYCLNHLKSPICPWCRKELPSHLLKQNLIVNSLPDNFINYYNNERQYLLIDPDDPEYSDSRILRIALRNIRRNYNRRNDRNNNIRNNNFNLDYPNNLGSRQRRHQLRNNLNNITRHYNNTSEYSNNDTVDDINNLIFDMEI